MLRQILQHRGRRAVLILLMAVVLAVVWSPVLNNDFLTNWDDQWMVLQNPYLLEMTHFGEVSGETVTAIATEPHNGQYSPINTLAYLGILKIAGQEASAFHLFSLLIHLVNFVLVGFVVQKLLHLMPDIHLSSKAITGIAWATAFLFAIHPLQVESIAWISASKIPLYSFFYLLGMWLYLLYKQSEQRSWLGIVFLCFIASLLAKEQAVVFVVILVAVDLVVCKNLKEKRIWLEKIPLVVVALFFGWFTLSIQGSVGVGGSYPLGQRLLFANYSLWEYVIKLVAPHNLSYFYFFPMEPGEPIPVRFWFYPVATGVFVWLLYEYRHKINRVYLFGGLFFLINIALVLHVLSTPRAAIIADRYVYLSSIGFFLVVVYGMVRLFRWNFNDQTKLRYGVVIGSVVYLLLLGGYTHQRTHSWKNSEILYQDVADVVEKHVGEEGVASLSVTVGSCSDE